MDKISKNFSMSEFIKSDTAIKRKIDNTPSKEVESNIKTLVINVLQPLRDYMECSATINSGYRCKALNDVVKGSKTSGHMSGRCADVTFGSKSLNKKAFEWVKNNCKYRQLIDEYDFKWVHIDYDKSDNKMQVLKIS